MNLDEFERRLRRALRDDPYWESYLPPLSGGAAGLSVHLAVFVEPYLGYVLTGAKTIESRFSAHQVAPYGCVSAGDVILLKASGGPVVALCRAANVWSYRLQSKSWREIRNEFAHAMCADDPEFWNARMEAAYATLIRLANVRPLPPLPFAKSDRRGWVVLSGAQDQLELATF